MIFNIFLDFFLPNATTKRKITRESFKVLKTTEGVLHIYSTILKGDTFTVIEYL